MLDSPPLSQRPGNIHTMSAQSQTISNPDRPRRAVALISGGLDSMLAAKVIQEQGIEVQGLNFYTGFCVEGHTHAIRPEIRATSPRS